MTRIMARPERRMDFVTTRFVFSLVALLCLAAQAAAAPSPGARTTARSVFDSIVKVSAKIPSSARTAATLGREREGSGVVIDSSGLVLTIGYVMLEAEEVTIGLY